MNNSETFYKSIATHYDCIFPLNEKAVSFTASYLPKEAKVLDVGCAVGTFSCELAKFCKDVEAFDLSAEMIAIAKQRDCKAARFRIADMLKIAENYPSQYFDTTTCFGNTLVHLLTKELQLSFLQQVYKSLKKGGVFLLQILNYDTIFEQKITKLPLIENEKNSFIRQYEFNENQSVFNFHTELRVKSQNKVIINVAKLFALCPKDLRILLENAGFSKVEMYSSFAEDSLSNEKLPLVVVARKNR